LNVRLDVAQLLPEPPVELQLPDQLRAEPLLTSGCLWAILGPDGARVEHSALLRQHRPVADWTVCRCLNCGCVTHAVCERPGVATAVSRHLLSEPARIGTLQQSQSYSRTFRIVLPQLADSLERAVAPPQSPRAHPALAAALRSMKQCLNAYLKREELRTEVAIQSYREEKLSELKERKQRALDQSQAFASLLVRVEDQLRLSPEVEEAGGDGDSQTRHELPPHQRHVIGGVFLMEADDIEVAEEAEERVLQDEEEEELDTDDSGVEEPPPVDQLARSLPVHIPVPAALLDKGRLRPAQLEEEEEVPDIDQMAASIRQLAQSLHTEPGGFAALPRPRTNTMHR